MARLLPPEDDGGCGQGYVPFSIRPRADIVLGTVVTDQASIVFTAGLVQTFSYFTFAQVRVLNAIPSLQSN